MSSEYGNLKTNEEGRLIKKMNETNEMKKVKQQKTIKGITLIALVITIIVLLILAGVTIASITGGNGIIINAAKAKEETEIGREKEIVELSYVKAGSDGDVNKKTLQEEIDKYDRDTKVYTDEDNYIIEFKDTGRVYKVDKDGNVTVEDSGILTADKTPR